jgi:hypothetical protein
MKKKHLGVFLIAFGMLALVLFLFSFRNCKATSAWPSTTGKILSSQVKEDSADDTATARVQYEYIVDEEIFTSKTIRAFGIGKFNFAEPASRVKDFPVGKEVTVYYNPENHSQSVLLHGLPDKWYIFIVGVCVVFLTGAFIIVNEVVDHQETETTRSH